MAYAVAYMRSILGSNPFLVKLYTFFLCRGIFFWLPITKNLADTYTNPKS